jgi:MOSC domain-containing protein YiiM
MSVVALCLSPTKSGPMVPVLDINVVAGAGIIGDRYYGSEQRHPGQNLTLIELEEIDSFNSRNGAQIALTDPRRNIVTRNVRLNALVGKEFIVGSVHLRGIELCEPCSTLAKHLAASGLTKRAVVREFTHRAGLRADVVSSGRIMVGDTLTV